MARWTCGLNKTDKVPNKHIIGSLQMRKISDKMKEKGCFVKFFGHAYRRDKEHLIKRMLYYNNGGKRRRGRRKLRVEDVTRKDMEQLKINTRTAKEINLWKISTSFPDPGKTGDTTGYK